MGSISKTFEIYRIKEGLEFERYRGLDSTELDDADWKSSGERYELVFSGRIPGRFTWDRAMSQLAKLLSVFRMSVAGDDLGGDAEDPVAVGDVVVVRIGDEGRAYYNESIWFNQIEGFAFC